MATYTITAGAAGGLTLAGSDLTERSTALVGSDAADLSSVTGLNIAQGTPVYITFKFRRTAGAGFGAFLGLKINGTQVVSSGSANRIAETSSIAEAASGIVEIAIYPGEANYERCLTWRFYISGVSNGNGASSSFSVIPTNNRIAAAIPTAAITSITITGDANNAATTLFTDELRVYTLPTS